MTDWFVTCKGVKEFKRSFTTSCRVLSNTIARRAKRRGDFDWMAADNISNSLHISHKLESTHPGSRTMLILINDNKIGKHVNL